MATQSHGSPEDQSAYAEPLRDVAPAPRRSAAEEARTLVAQTTTASLATLSEDGTPWSSLVRIGLTATGDPVLVVSTMAEHGRNLHREAKASVCVGEEGEGDPLDRGRVTLAGAVVPGDDAALRAYEDAVPTARGMAKYADFDVWVLRVDRVRWVGGFARMDSVTAADYAAAAPDPTGAAGPGAARHMTEDHADALLLMARHLGGFPDAETARCLRCDRLGLDLAVTTPRGPGSARIAWAQPVTQAGGLRAAAVELTQRARAAAGSGA